jgi:hypothetical protein
MTVLRTCNTQETAELIMWYSDKIERNFLKHKPPKYLSNVFGHPNDTRIIMPPTIPPLPLLSSSSTPPTNNEMEQQYNNDSIENLTVINNEIQQPQPINDCFTISMKKSKKENITPENIGVLILSQIPNINTITANSIMQKYDFSMKKLMDDLNANINCLDNFHIQNIKDGKTRKISSSAVKNIQIYLLH